MRNGFATLLQVVQNDFGYDLSFQLEDATGADLDISGATLAFRAQSESDYAVKFENAMAVVNASSGTCKYTVRSTDFVVSGGWSAQVVVTYNSGEVLTFTGIVVTVEPELPLSQ